MKTKPIKTNKEKKRNLSDIITLSIMIVLVAIFITILVTMLVNGNA